MIELILGDRCTGCGDCVAVCPTHVFDPGTKGVPLIARPEECQTCFMCELHCRADAIYVGPDRDRFVKVEPEEVLNAGLLGQYRRDSGWDEWAAHPEYTSQFWRMPDIMNGGREMTEARAAKRCGGR